MSAVPNPQDQQRFERLTTYLARDPGNLMLLEEAADAALLCGLKTEAMILLDRALVIEPASPSLQFKKGKVLLATQDYPGAAAAYQQMVDAGNYHPAISYNLAYALFASGQPVEALKQLDSIAPAWHKELPQLELLYARTLHRLQDHEQALRHADAYVGLNPGDPEGQGLKALLLYDSGENDLAASIAHELLVKRERDPMAHLVLGSIALEVRDGTEAEAHFRQVVDDDPSAGRSWSGLAFAMLLQSRLDDAVGHFETAVRYMPDHLGTWHGLAWARIMQRDFDGARAAVDAAMALDRTFSENHGTLAVLLVLQGRIPEAETEAKRGMRLNPRSAASHFARSLLLAHGGDAAGSRRLVNKILAGSGLQSQEGIAETILSMAGLRKRDGGSR